VCVVSEAQATANQDKAWKSGANEGTRNGDIHERPEVVSCSARRKVPGKWSSQSMVCALTGTGSIASISPTTDVAGPVKSGAAICALMSTRPKKKSAPARSPLQAISHGGVVFSEPREPDRRDKTASIN